MSYMKPVIREPYYDKPIWIENEVNRKEFTFLSSKSSDAEVEFFYCIYLATTTLMYRILLKNLLKSYLSKMKWRY